MNPTPVRPMLGDIELRLVQKLRTEEDRVWVEHAVPALEGSLVQHLGRGPVRVRVEGVMADTRSLEDLEGLRQLYQAAAPVVFAADIMTAGEMPKVSVSDSLADVMKQLGTHRGEIPVLDGTRLAGVVWPQDVIARYNTEVFKRDMARSVASAVDQDDTEVNLVRDTVVAEVTVPSGFVSRTLRDLDIRGKFGVSVLMVKHRTPGGTKVSEAPSPDYTFRDGDVMLVMGPGNRVHQLKRAS